LPDVSVHLDYADMETVLSQAASQRQEYPEKTDEWKHKNEFARKIGTTFESPACRELWERIAGEYARNPGQPVAIDGHTVQCGNRQSSNGHVVFCMHISQADWFKTKLGLASEDKTEEWKCRHEFAKLLRTAGGNEAYNRLWQRVEAAYRAAPERPVVIQGHTIRCGIRKAGKHIFCLHTDEAAWLRSMIRPEEAVKTGEWLAKGDVERALKLKAGREDFQALWAELEQAHLANPEAPIVGDQTVRCGPKMASTKKVFCVHRSELPWMAQRLGKNLPDRTEDWLARFEFAHHIHVSRNAPEYNALWSRIEAALNSASGEPVMIDGHVLKAQRMQAGGNQSTYVHMSEADWFRQRLGRNLPEKTERWLAKADLARHLHVTFSNAAFNALWAEIEAAFLAAPQEAMTIRGHRLRFQRMQSRSQQPLCMHISEADWFQQEMVQRVAGRPAITPPEQGHQNWTEEVERNGRKSIGPRPIDPDRVRNTDRPDESRGR
jgi:hypothetical protein